MRIWEEELDQPLLRKTLRLLSEAYPGGDMKSVGHLSIGDRDARLLQMREWMFGPLLRIIANCPQCREMIEWESNIDNFKLQPVLPELNVRTFTLEKDGYHIRFRLPDTYDISKAINDPSYLSDQNKLIRDCILEKSRDGEKFEGYDLPEAVWNALDDRMGKEDPQADIRMDIKCPACSHHWEASFDITGYIWAEIENWAHRVMREVVLLARSFGWAEKDILQMSPMRRQLYIQMLTG